MQWLQGGLIVVRAAAKGAAEGTHATAELALEYAEHLMRSAFVGMAPSLAVQAVGLVGQVFSEYTGGFLAPLHVGGGGGTEGLGGRAAGLIARRLGRPMGVLASIAEREVLDLSSEGTEDEHEQAAAATGAALLGGLRSILPCLTKEVMEGEETRNSFLRMAEQAITNHAGHVVRMPPAAVATLVGSIASSLSSPRQETAAAAMSALYDLAEFHAQGTTAPAGGADGPLSAHFRATPGLLAKLIGPTLSAVLHPSRAPVLGPRAAQLLLAVAVCDTVGFRTAMQRIAKSQATAALGERFMSAVGGLMGGARPALDKRSRKLFRERFDAFLVDAMGYVAIAPELGAY